MKKRYSIGFLVLILIILILLIMLYKVSYEKAVDRNEKRMTESEKAEECYYIKNDDGFVTVYTHDMVTVYEYTSILVEDLPEDIQEDLNSGIKVKTIREIYGFLENYSS